MATFSIQETRAKVAAWAQSHRHAVLYDEQNSTLLDVASGKSLVLSWRQVTAFEEKTHPETKDTYLVLLFENGNQIALADPGGVAFPPSEANMGPGLDLPPVICLRDFYTLKQRVDHYLIEHRDEPVSKETLSLVMICIAILDGARAVGFDVRELEEDLEKSLREIERRKE